MSGQVYQFLSNQESRPERGKTSPNGFNQDPAKRTMYARFGGIFKAVSELELNDQVQRMLGNREKAAQSKEFNVQPKVLPENVIPLAPKAPHKTVEDLPDGQLPSAEILLARANRLADPIGTRMGAVPQDVAQSISLDEDPYRAAA